jgi:hypothetical protein
VATWEPCGLAAELLGQRVRGLVDHLRRRQIAALPDFVCKAGAVIGYRSSPLATPDEVLAAVRDKITEIMRATLSHPDGQLAGG